MNDNNNYYLVREIAEQQLIDALDMFEKGNFISSITLAGAAEEILGKMPPENGSIASSSNEHIPNIFEAFSSRAASELNIDIKVIRELMNKPRNIAKHYIQDHIENDGTFKISINSVESMLIRCIAQYNMVVDENKIPDKLKEKYSYFLAKIGNTHKNV